MKALIVFEESADEPMGPIVAAAQEVLAQPPALEAKVGTWPSQQSNDPADRIPAMCEQAFVALRATADCERCAFFLPALVRDPIGDVVFHGQVVLFLSRKHLLKISLVKKVGTTVHPVVDRFFELLMPVLAEKFLCVVPTDEDRELLKLIIKKVTDGLNLATSRFSTDSGSA